MSASLLGDDEKVFEFAETTLLIKLVCARPARLLGRPSTSVGRPHRHAASPSANMPPPPPRGRFAGVWENFFRGEEEEKSNKVPPACEVRLCQTPSETPTDGRRSGIPILWNSLRQSDLTLHHRCKKKRCLRFFILVTFFTFLKLFLFWPSFLYFIFVFFFLLFFYNKCRVIRVRFGLHRVT